MQRETYWSHFLKAPVCSVDCLFTTSINEAFSSVFVDAVSSAFKFNYNDVSVVHYLHSSMYVYACSYQVCNITLLNRKHIVNHTFRYSLAAIIIPRRVWLLLTHQFCKDHDQSTAVFQDEAS